MTPVPPVTATMPVQSSRLDDGRWRARLVDVPHVEAYGGDKAEAVARLKALVVLLRGSGQAKGRVC